MLQNYITVALRNLAKHRLFSFINIAGLAVALACAMLIMLFVRDELSFDKFMPDHERIYRAEVAFYPPGRDPLTTGSSMYPLSDKLKTEITGIEDSTRMSQQGSAVKYGDRQFFEKISPTDPNFFQLLRFKLLKGDPATVIARPDTIVISESIARKYFGDEDPIGKTLMIDEVNPVEVTGIMADVPANSHLDFNMVIPLGSKADRAYGPKGADDSNVNSWTSVNFNAYFRVAPGTSIDNVTAQFPDMVRRHVNPAALGLPSSMDGWDLLKITATPYGEVHLAAKALSLANREPGDWTTIYGFSTIAALILLIAAINFMNLATARAIQRAREVAMRKVVGANRTQLVVQFLGESVLIALFALALALALVELLLPAFAAFLDRPITLGYLKDWDVSLGVVAAAVVTGLFGGIYPALVLSGFRPATVLKSNRSGQSGSGALRTTLVVVQFAISIGLGVVAAVVYSQTLYARTYDVGLARENRLILTGIGRDQVVAVRDTLRTELLALPGVTGVAGSDNEAFSGNENNTVWRLPQNPDEILLISQMIVEPEFFDTYGIKLLAGRLLSRDRGEDLSTAKEFGGPEADNVSVIINESTVRRLGYASPEEAIGKTVREDTGPGTAETPQLTSRVIVGVVADAHFDSLRQPILPTRYIYNPNFLNHYTIAIDGKDTARTVKAVEDVWNRLVPALPVRLGFLDQNYDKLYAQDAQRGQMFAIFAGFAVLIACLGLFGLAAFTAERRTKEIGVRKVFGANVGNIVTLLLWQFSKPVLIANLIAWPVAWYYLTGWLDGFAYRIELNPLYFVAAGLGALLIAWLTVTLHSVRVARAKPVLALRYE